MAFLDADTVLWPPHTGMHTRGSQKGVGRRGEGREREREGEKERRRREISECASGSSAPSLSPRAPKATEMSLLWD